MSKELREPSSKYLARANFMQTEIGQIPNDWSVASLREVTDAARPISYGIVQTGPNLADGVPCIRVVDIDNGRLNTSGLIYTSEAISSAYKRTVLRAGDLIMPLRGKVGDVAEVGSTLEGANLTRGVALLSIRIGIVGSYCRHALAWPATRRRLEQSMNGSALQEIPIAALRTFQIALPREEQEQHAIATALSDVDALIAGLERLIAKKRDIKQATMQQLLTGQTRLPGFSEKWESRNVGDFTDCTAGGTPSTGIASYWNGSIRWMNSGELNQKQVFEVEGRISDVGLANSSTKLIPAKCVLVGLAGQGKTRGTVAINHVELCTNQSIAAIFPNKSFVPEYLYYNLDSRYDELRELSTGDGGRGGLNLQIIRHIAVPFPSIKEQAAIATVLSDMDTELSALEARLTKTRAIKQGMMQELLTGRTRLV